MVGRRALCCVLGLTSAVALFGREPKEYLGSAACAGCHQDIAQMYGQTAMAHASGPVSQIKLPGGQLSVARQHAEYRVEQQDHATKLTYRKAGSVEVGSQGSKELLYFIGSGTHARGFVFEEAGQSFQSPLAYYGGTHGWDLAPGYEKERSIYLGRKVETGCLSCHASGVRRSPTEPLFREGAVSCERCHGPGSQHVATVRMGRPEAARSSIVNPAKLSGETRDSVCAQCHLTGETRIDRPQRSAQTFQAGDHLAEHVVPFVRATADEGELKVIGHFEGLWQSKCKLASGEKLWCGTCHDPHRQVAASEKADYYRDKCLSCHQQNSCRADVATRASRGDSCIACHMTERATTDGQHTAFTDHSISRLPRTTKVSVPGAIELRSFWPKEATIREVALAYADEAWRRGDAASARVAHQKLEAAYAIHPGDAAVTAQLAYTYDLGGVPDRAEALYRQALDTDGGNLIALTNLATHLAQKGQVEEAIRLWRRALAIDPGLQAAGLNLARAEASQGKKDAAYETLRQVLSLHPGLEAARSLALEIAKTP